MRLLRAVSFAFIALSCLVTPNANAAAANAPRVGWSKMLFALPNASAPAQLLDGLDAEVVQQYEDMRLVNVPHGSIPATIGRSKSAGVDSVVHDEYDTLQLPGGIIDTRLGTATSLPGRTLSPPPSAGEQGLWLVQFVGPLLQSWQEAVRQIGVTLVQYVPYNAFIVAATPEQIRLVEQLPTVQFVDVYHKFLKSDSVPRVTGERLNIMVVFPDAPGVNGAVGELAALSDTELVQWKAGNYVQAVAHLGAADTDVMISHPLVVAVSYSELLHASDERVATSLTRNVDAAGTPLKPTGYKAWLSEICDFCGALKALYLDNFHVGVADLGLDGGIGGTHHPDLPESVVPGQPSKIRYGTNFWTSQDEDPSVTGTQTQYLKDLDGHGTLVSGVIAADTASLTDAGGFYWATGVAPTAGIFITKIRGDCRFDAVTDPCPTELDTNTNSFNDVFKYAADARNSSPTVFIQNHSRNQYRFGNGTGSILGVCIPPMDGKYSWVASNFDAAVRDADGDASLHGVLPMTLTVSAGNRGQQPYTTGCPTDPTLTLPPGTAKNVISVGGAESVRGSTEAWGCMDSQADSFSNIMGNSKRSTKIAGWYKPDLMAPAANIVSLLSAAVTGTGTAANARCTPTPPGSPAPPSTNGYRASTGTSFSAPVAAGAALLAARVYAERISPGCSQTPGACVTAGASASPALIKGILIAGARSMRGGEDRAVAPPWNVKNPQTSTQAIYNVGEFVRPTRASVTGLIYRATAITTGQVGTVEPVWPTSGSVDDGGVTWTVDAALSASRALTAPTPNEKQGFGRINLEDVLDSYPAKTYVNDAGPILDSGSPWLHTYAVHESSLPVKVVLTWSDPPGLVDETVDDPANPHTYANPLVNDLDLTVEEGVPCVRMYVGNRTEVAAGVERSTAYTTCAEQLSLSDSINNVEIVTFYPTSPPLPFTVRVRGKGPMNQKFSLVILNGYDSALGAPPAKPSGFSAYATSSTSTHLQWGSSGTGVRYEIRRKANGGAFVTLPNPAPTATSFDDTGLSSNTAYVYEVRARKGSAPNEFFSAYATDVATTMTFSDEPIQAQQTLVRATHINELRSAANSLRLAAGLPQYTFSETLVAGETAVKAIHLTELRDKLAEAFTALGIPVLNYAHQNITNAVSIISAVDLQELRDAVK